MKITENIQIENSDKEIKEIAKFEDFDFKVLADFCRIKNRGNAYLNSNEHTPRVKFLVELIESLGLTAEVDIWSENRFARGTSLSDILNFDIDDIDNVVDEMPNLNEDDRVEEKRVLNHAFEIFDTISIQELKNHLRQLENSPTASKAEKRIYNMMIRFKKDIASATVTNYYNIYIKGTGNVAIMAHHDIVNPNSDNCNDNSASCINVIAAKLLNPNVHVIINDAEEIGGLGAARSAAKIKEGYFGEIDFVLNLELTAVGGKNFFIEKFNESSQSKLFERITKLFPGVDLYSTPFHDGIIMRRNGIDSLVINPLPRKADGELRYDLLYLCHSDNDSIRLANYNDMKDFVTDVVTPIIDGRVVERTFETNAPVDTVLCSAKSSFNDDYAVLKVIEENGVKMFELKYKSFHLEDINLYELQFFKIAYTDFLKKCKFSMKIEVDEFRNFTYYV